MFLVGKLPFGAHLLFLQLIITKNYQHLIRRKFQKYKIKQLKLRE